MQFILDLTKGGVKTSKAYFHVSTKLTSLFRIYLEKFVIPSWLVEITLFFGAST